MMHLLLIVDFKGCSLTFGCFLDFSCCLYLQFFNKTLKYLKLKAPQAGLNSNTSDNQSSDHLSVSSSVVLGGTVLRFLLRVVKDAVLLILDQLEG